MPSFKTWWEKSYYAKQERIFLHLLFWCAYLCFLGFTAFKHLRIINGRLIPTASLIGLSPVYLVWVYYFFVNTAYVRFRQKQIGKAFAATAVTVALYAHSDVLLSYVLTKKLAIAGVASKLPQASNFGTFYRHELLSWFSVSHALLSCALYIGLPVFCKFFRDLQRSYQRLNELRERNMQLEINLIKSQVNPHFLLNTLNNIYGFTISGSRQQIGEMIMNLSGFLKYSLYDCNNEFVPLSKEVVLIQNYIQLEEVRSDFIETSFEVQTDDADYTIPAFTLFPLVENAFKHGTSDLTGPTRILVKLTVVNGYLHFSVENDLRPGKAGHGGFGLQALKKKIEYYYHARSTIAASTDGSRYIAKLQITGI